MAATRRAPDILPFVDEHETFVAAPPDAVRRAFLARFARGRGAAAVARVVGAEPRHGDGPVGFEVTESDGGRRLRLAGRHRFSRYALTVTLTERPTGTKVTARTDAAFPGPLGAAYRTLVITSGAHRRLMRHL